MHIKFVILAAGKGTRMQSDIPKALTRIGEKPILQYLFDSIQQSGVDGTPVVVVGHGRDKLCEFFGAVCDYAVQDEPLGTGHAVMCAREKAAGADAVAVLYGDHPFVSSQTLRNLAELHQTKGAVISMMTTTVPSFEGWHSVFLHWGRILRDGHGHMIGIREYKDAMESEQEIREVNPAMYCFDAAWLWDNISQLKNTNAKGEYYLTDLIELAVAQRREIASLSIAPEEAIGINTPEELRIAEEVLAKRSNI